MSGADSSSLRTSLFYTSPTLHIASKTWNLFLICLLQRLRFCEDLHRKTLQPCCIISYKEQLVHAPNKLTYSPPKTDVPHLLGVFKS